MKRSKHIRHKAIAVLMAFMMTFSMVSPASIAAAVEDASDQNPPIEIDSSGDTADSADDVVDDNDVDNADNADNSQDTSEEGQDEDQPEAADQSESSRDAETFNANSYISKLTLSLTSGDKTKEYETEGSGEIDTRGDFPDGISRSATYVVNLNINTEDMLKAQGKYPFVAGDKIICSVPDIIRTGSGTTSGRLIDTTAEWNDGHDGVGDYTVSKDESGHNTLTITYDDGYVEEKSGKIIASSVRLSGGFDTSTQTTESFDTELVFGNLVVKAKFSKLEIIRNLSIEKTGETDGSELSAWGTPTYPRQGGATVDSDGYLTYTVKISSGIDNTYKLTNVKVTDLFDEASRSKVDLSTMTLVSVTNDGITMTDSAVALYDGDGNVTGWNIGDLGIGCEATVKFKVKINKEGITAAVDAAKAIDSSSDAVDARTIKNTASVSADDTDAVSHDYSTIVKNYVKVSKSTKSFDTATQRQHFTITVTSPEDNRYTMHNVPIQDYLSSDYLDASYYKGSGIASISVKHSDETTEPLAYGNYKQVDSRGNADSRSWYATISELCPGDVVTIDAYLELDESYWSHVSGSGYVGNNAYTYNYVYVGNVGQNGYYANDINKTYNYSSFLLAQIALIKTGSLDKNNGTISWTITGNESNKFKEPGDVAGLVITDTLGPNQVFTGNTATVVFYKHDGSKAGEDSFVLAAGTTSFTYKIPDAFGKCKYQITYTSTITDWDTYIGPEKSYTNTVNGYTASTGTRPRVAAMSKQFVEQADDWSQWKTEIFSTLQNGDVYQDTSRSGINYMYFTQEDLDAINLTIDDVSINQSLYEIKPVEEGSSEGKYSSYTITFKGNVSAELDGASVSPSKEHPLVVSYKAHMVNPSSGTRDYYNDAKLTSGNVSDEDYDYCRRNNSREILKTVDSSGNGEITWYLRTNYLGYSGQPDGTCTVTDVLPAGLTYKECKVKTAAKYGQIDSVTPVVNEDGTTTLTIKISGLLHDEVCKAHTRDNNNNVEFQFYITTKITDSEYLYGSTSKNFSYTNTASLNDRYGNLKTSNASANIEHVAMKKTMVYNQSTAPYAQFSIEANADKADLNPDGDKVRIVDESSKSLSIDLKSISVVDGKTGDPLDFAVDASQMANNIFVVEVPDNTYVKIIYQAQVVGEIGKPVPVNNNAYYEGYKTTSGESTIAQDVTVLKTSGEAESEPMVWFSKKNESAQALAGATYRLDAYNEASQMWETVRNDIESTGDNTRKGVKVEDLELNTLYRFVETAAPESVYGAPQGYVLDTTPHYFVLYKDTAPTVSYPDDVDSDDVIKAPSGSVITVYDVPYTKVLFAKMSYDDTQLAGGEFAVYSVDSDGNVSDAPACDKSGNEVKFFSSAHEKNEFVIAPGTYQIVETKAPAGYAVADPVTFVVKGDSEHTVTVNGQTVQTGVGELDLSPIIGNLSMTDASLTTNLTVSKSWNDEDDFDNVRPSSVNVQLFADYGDDQGYVAVVGDDGNDIIANITASGADGQKDTDDDWKASFDNLPVMKNGVKISYIVKEFDPQTGKVVESGSVMSNGYTVTVGGVSTDDDGNCSITVGNSYQPKKTNIIVSKIWVGDDSDSRPDSILVDLLRDGTKVDSVTITPDGEGSWKYVFDHLDKFDSDGKAYNYTVEEQEVEGYVSAVAGDVSNGFTITNTKKTNPPAPEPQTKVGNLTVSKTVTGNAADTTRDFSFTVTLASKLNGTYGGMVFADGVASFTLRHGQSATATGLPAGTAYTITETGTDGYTVTVNGTASATVTGIIEADKTVVASYVNDKTADDPVPDPDPSPDPSPDPDPSPKPSPDPDPSPAPDPSPSPSPDPEPATDDDSSNNDVPKTSDSSNTVLYGATAGVSAIALAIVLFARRKKGKNDK